MKSKAGVLCVSFFACIVLYPALFILLGSLMGEAELAGNLAGILDKSIDSYVSWSLLPKEGSVESYRQLMLFEPGFFVLFWNTVKICAGVIIGQLLIAVPAAWGFAMYDFPLKKMLFMLYIIFMMLPFQVLMLPEYMVLSRLRLIDTLWAVILPGAFSTFPVFIIYNFFKGIPEQEIEAARLDGAGEFRIFLSIGIPAGRSGIAAAMILQFLEYWNIVEQPMIFLDSEEKLPLSLYLPHISMENAGIAFAAAFLSLIPSVLIFRLGQESLEAGITATTMKR